MNGTWFQGKWIEIKGKLKEQWGELTDDELDTVAGRRDQLLGLIQQRYGRLKEEAERELAEWERRHGL